MQVLHVDGNHWITVSNCVVAATDASVHVYDSMMATRMSLRTKQQVCSLFKPSCEAMNFHIVKVMPQSNTVDCGVFALANATELLFGEDPAKAVWDVGRMRPHLLQCLEKGRMERFPVNRYKRVPLGGRAKKVIVEDIHCMCKMPYDKDGPEMIECSSCKVWYHGTCVKIEVKDFVKKKWQCGECARVLT